MFRFIILISVYFCALDMLAVERPIDKMLKTSAALVSSSDKASIDLMKENLDIYKEAHVRNSIVEVVSYALLRDKGDFETFKTSVKSQYPGVDFSFVEKNQGNYDQALKSSLSNLVLNASSATQVMEGNSPLALTVKPRMVAEVAELGTIVKEEPLDVEGTDSVEIAKVATPEITDTPLPDESEEGKTRTQDIAKDSIYYKVYHAAKGMQAGKGKAILEMKKLSFEKANTELTEAVIKAMALGMLSAKSSSYGQYAQNVKQAYEDNDYLGFLQEEPFQVACGPCKGLGHKELKCRSCINGSCRNCGAKGTITVKGLSGTETKMCPTCRGDKNCKQCKGEKVTKKDCRACANKGTRFNGSILSAQYKEAVQYLIDAAPQLAKDDGLYIGVGDNPLALARLDALRSAKAERLRMREELAAREKEEELARLEIRRQKKAAKEAARIAKEEEKKALMDAENGVIVTEIPESGTNPNLTHAVLEVRNYLDAQEKRTKSNIYEKCSGSFVKGRPVLVIQVSDGFQNSARNYKEQVAEGFYRFWKLRAQQNGVGSNVTLELEYDGATVGVCKDEEIKIK
jgi:hypothetical protein